MRVSRLVVAVVAIASLSAGLVAVGAKKRPDRQLEDTWIGLLDTIRNAFWGEPPQ